MKKYILLVFLIGLFMACDHEKIETYSGIDQVYFTHHQKGEPVGGLTDSMYVNLKEILSVEYKEDSIIDIPVALLGGLRNYDRSIKVSSKDTLIEDGYVFTAALGEDYEVLEAKVPAGKETGYVRLKLKNSERLMREINGEDQKGDTLIAYIKLFENENFHVDYDWKYTSNKKKNSTEYRVFFYSTVNLPPRIWREYVKTGAEGMVHILGEYSTLKMDVLLAANPDLSYDLFEYTDEEALATGETTSYAQARAMFISRFGDLAIYNRWRGNITNYLREQGTNIPEITWGTWKVLYSHPK